MKSYFRQAGRTVARTFDFRGSASRSEFIGYLVLSQLPLIVIALAAAWIEPSAAVEALMLAAMALVTVPLAALSIRRFHDFGRSGWWSAPFLALVVRTLALDLIGLAAGWSVRSPIEMVLSYVDWLLILPAVISFAAMLAWPSRPGNETTGAGEPAPVA